jgi:hypothetical protein
MRLLIDGARLRDTLRLPFRGQMAHNEKGSPGSLRIAALIALLSGGGGSVVLVLRAVSEPPRSCW